MKRAYCAPRPNRAILALLIVTAGCAAPVAPRSQRNLDAVATQRLVEGCYDCLLEARHIRAALVESGSAIARKQLFEIDLLLALRRKELALDPAESLSAASEIEGTLFEGESSTLTQRVAQLPSDDAGTPREEVIASRALSASARQEVLTAALATLARRELTPVVAEYVSLALRCAYSSDPLSDAAAFSQALSVPLLTYRRALCTNPNDAPALQSVRATVPRFAEAAFFEGRAAFATRSVGDGRKVGDALALAAARFPDSPSVTLQRARLAQTLGDCRRAIDLFTSTLALRPRHEAAKLGRTVCRSEMGDANGAIVDATDLIERPTPVNQGEALYWRAWNLRSLNRLGEARADSDRAKKLLYNSRMLTLAGMIEHDQSEFAIAATDLVEAKALDSQNCTALWYLGRVRRQLGEILLSASEFARAADCNDALAEAFEEARRSTREQTGISEEFRAQQLASFENSIAESRSAASAAALNAASNYADKGDRAQALRLTERAAADPARRDEAMQVRKRVEAL